VRSLSAPTVMVLFCGDVAARRVKGFYGRVVSLPRKRTALVPLVGASVPGLPFVE
jgi:hypothetical protein